MIRNSNKAFGSLNTIDVFELLSAPGKYPGQEIRFVKGMIP
jgi:hypothetical protein